MSFTKNGKSNIGLVMVFVVSTVLNTLDASAAEIVYSGHISEENGISIEGPLDFTVRFYNAEKSGDLVGPTLNLANTKLRDGVFELSLNLDNSQLSAVFGDGSKSVFVEIEAGGKTYPRQRLVALPLALRVPVDTNSLNYNNEGKLTIDRVDINQVSGLSAVLAAKADTTSVASSSVKMANNLSDLANPAAARTNLGLGALATASSISNGDISTSAAIADTKLGTIATAGKVSGSAITSGTIAGTTAFNSSGSITSSGNFVVNSTGSATTELRFNDIDNSNYVGFKSPGIVSINKIWTLPAADGTNGQLLKTDGSGTLSWISAGGGGDLLAANNLGDLANAGTARTNLGLGTLATNNAVTSALITDGTIVDGDINATAAIADTKLATISTAGKVSGSAITSGTIGGSTIVATSGQLSSTGNIRVAGTGIAATDLRFGDNDDSNYVGLKAPATVGTNFIWTLPSADGTANQALSTNGSGVFQWVTPMLGSNNLSDLANAGAARTNLGLGSLATNSAITSALITDGTIVDADINTSAAIADTKLATISTAGKVSGSAITSGTIGGSTIVATSGQLSSTGNIRVAGTGIAATDLRFGDNDDSNYVGLKAPATVGTNFIWTLPASDGTANQALSTNGSGVLQWVTPMLGSNNLSDLGNAGSARTNLGLGTLATNSAVTSALITDNTIVDADINASAAISDTKLATISTAGKVSGSAITSGTIAGTTAFNSSGTITTSAAITGTGNIIVNGTGSASTELRFNDDDNSNYVGLKSPATVTANKVWTLPAADGTNGQLLKTDGSGSLSWVSAGGGGDLFAANNLSDLANAGTARTNLGLGTLATNNSVTSALITDGTIVDADINTSAAIADTKLATISTAGKVSGSAITSGTIGGSTIVATSGQLSSTGNIRVAGTGIAATDLRFGDNDDSNYVGLKAPATVGTNFIWTLPASDGTANQALSTNGSGVLQWVAPMLGSNNLSDLGNAGSARTNLGLGTLATNSAVTSALITDDSIVDADINASAAIADTKLATISTAGKVSGSAITSGTIAGTTAFNSSGTITTSAAITGTGNIIVNGTGSASTELRFNDDDNSNYVGLKSPATVTANKVWTLPAADGTNGQLLKTDGSGSLSWVSAGGGGDLFASNNLSDLANAGTARTNLGLGTLATNNSVTSALITDGTIVDADINTSAAIADTKLATISTAGKVSGSAITSGTIGGSTIVATSGQLSSTGNIRVAGTGIAATDLRFGDNDDSNYVGLKAPATVGTNFIWTLPASDGTANQALSTNGSGVLQWVTPMLGSNNLSDLGNAGSARTNLGLGTLATNSAVTSALITDGTIVDADINASAAISDTKLATISTAGKVSGSAITSGTIAGTTAFNSSGTITTSAAITGTGNIIVNGTGSASTELRFNDDDNSNYVGLKSPATVTANKVWTLPDADGTNGFVLQTDGSGTLSWITNNPTVALASGVSGTLPVANGGTGITGGTSGGVPYFSAASTLASSTALTANGVMLGGGAGAAPTATAAGAAYQLLRIPSGGGAPVFGALDLSQSAAVTNSLAVANGGTGGTTAATGRSGLGAAASGANADITSLAGLTTALSVGQGGTGATTLTNKGMLYGTGTTAITATTAGAQYEVFQAGATGTPTVGPLNLAQSAATTGSLPVNRGGSGAATFTANHVLLGNGTSAFQTVAPGTSGNVLTSDGTTWSSSPVFPVGTVLDFAGASVPTGYLDCDGSAVSRTTYATLFAVLGTTWGAGNGSTTFNLPDLRGRVSVGAGQGSGLTLRSLAGSGGEEDHTIALSELPAYKYLSAATDATDYMYNSSDTSRNYVKDPTMVTGGGAPLNVMQPFRVLKKMIKY